MATLSMATGRLWISTGPPGISEENVELGNFWLNTALNSLFICINPAIGAQVWTLVTGV